MEQGLRDCDLALIFFSKAFDPRRPDEGPWFHAEVQSLMYRHIEEGCGVSPVMLDADVELPTFLRPLARRGIEEFDAIVDAIEGRSAKPPLGPGRVRLSVTPYGQNIDRTLFTPLTPPLGRSTAEVRAASRDIGRFP
jgi:hypothetical protein